MSVYHLPIINRSEIPYIYIYIHKCSWIGETGEWRERSLSCIQNYYNVEFNYKGAEPNFTIKHVGISNNILQNDSRSHISKYGHCDK